MEDLKKKNSILNREKAHIKDAASELYDEGAKLAQDLYSDTARQIDGLEKEATEITDKFLDHVRENPLKSILIAGGVGFLLSILLKK